LLLTEAERLTQFVFCEWHFQCIILASEKVPINTTKVPHHHRSVKKKAGVHKARDVFERDRFTDLIGRDTGRSRVDFCNTRIHP